jgi:hypothetical protein
LENIGDTVLELKFTLIDFKVRYLFVVAVDSCIVEFVFLAAVLCTSVFVFEIAFSP